ncbi:ATP synthase subunit I, partial [Cronobacter sakazakii]|uniref:ATP synthase subunit I n=1 Tax=Cronobacter sakazakii TaxID=28141 RepID=UPI001F3C78C5
VLNPGDAPNTIAPVGRLKMVKASAKEVVRGDDGLFRLNQQAHTPAKGRVAWSFAFGEAFKVIATFTLLVVALACLKAVFLPLIVTWVSVLVVQILAPAVINNKG